MAISDVLLSTGRMPARDAALGFTRAGIPVFPCVPGGKVPLTRAGFHDASRDDEQVVAWWTRWPNANLGVPTGNASGIDVVDVDVAGETSGFTAFERAARAGLVDGELARVRTPSGGLHVYYPTSPSRPQRCWQAAAAHIDFRGTGGYVLVPPSIVANGDGAAGYRLFALSSSDARPIDAESLRNFIDPRPVREPMSSATGSSPDPARLAGWVGRLRQGERNHGLFWAACRLAEAGYASSDVEAALAPAAAGIGLPAREIATTIRSAVRQARGDPPRPVHGVWGSTPTRRCHGGETPCLP
ncbi:bifunctional DNA primase/polymerase [Agromyces sp. NPDC056523]|uniref:bifunctional DNA primase/polymerase n=1 Tax=Agromyces sp. NPDC056523 TaxID=3345850 RepID=UPI00366D81D5